jgi:squalene-associated FAD-dependent desaturase
LKNVIIIGAGVSGIAAAYRLVEQGLRVTVVESKSFVGGRVYSFQDNVTEEIVDNGQHALSGAYSGFLEILNSFGTSVYLNQQKSLEVNFAEKGNKFYRLFTGYLPGNAGIILGFLKLNSISFISKMLLFRFILLLKLGKIIREDLNSLDYLTKHKQNEELIRNFWEPLILAALNTKPISAPSSLLLNILNQAFFSSSKNSSLILSSIDLSVLLSPFSEWIKRANGELILGDKVVKIIFDNSVAIGVELKSGRKIYSDFIISSVQPNALLTLLKEGNKENSNYLNEFKYSTIINIYYWLDRYVESPDFVSLLGTTSQWMFNRSAFTFRTEEMKSRFPGLINITISNADDKNLNREELTDLCWNELCDCLHQFKQANVLRSKIIVDRHATFNSTTEMEPLRPDAVSGIDGLLLAGDWTKTGLPATIEGAVQSGFKAADIIKQSL